MEDDNTANDVPPPFGRVEQPTASMSPEHTTPAPTPPAQEPPEQSPSPEPVPPIAPPPPQVGAYYSNSQGYVASGPKTDTFAIVSLILGITTLALVCCYPISIVTGIISTVFGVVSMSRIPNSQGALSGRGLAIAGLICAVSGLLLVAVLFILGLLGTSLGY